jgi:hypothetical protein
VARFQSFGIENARIEKWGEFSVGFNRGPWFGQMIEPEKKPLEFGTNAWTAGTKGRVKGHVLLAPTNDDELEACKDRLPGAWVLVTAQSMPPRGPRPAQPDNASTPPDPTAEFRQKLQAIFAEAKIAGTIRGARRDLIITGGSYQVTWDKLPIVPAVNLVQSQYDEIKKLLEQGKSITLEFDIRNYFKPGPIPLYNVIADIPGTEFPDEYVIVGGHIDTWDGATGTTDNGTGCATTLEAARLLMKSGARPRRTIRFMLWSGEEQGLLGSRAYVRAHPELMPKISAVLVHDGGTNYLSGISVTKAMKADVESAFASVIGLDESMPFTIREVAGLRGGGSDHASFLAEGAPGFFWRQSGTAVYSRTHHTQHDTYDAAIPEYQKHSSLVAALGALGIANLDHLLSREGMIAPGGTGGFGGGRRLGVQLEEMTVVEVLEEGVALKAGVKTGDQLLKFDGKLIASMEDYFTAMSGAEAPKLLTVKRDGREVELKLEFPARPNNP